MLDETDYKQLIANALYNKGLIDETIYEKCSKPHISSLPGDLRSSDAEKLQKRYDAVNKRINKIKSEVINDGEDMRKKYNEKEYKSLDKITFEKSQPHIKRINTLIKKLEKELKNANIEEVSEKERLWATGLRKPDVLFGSDELIYNARKKLIRQLNYELVNREVGEIKNIIENISKKDINNQNGNSIASNLTFKLKDINGKLRWIKDRNASSTAIVGVDIPVEPVIELPSTFDKTFNKLTDYTTELTYQCNKISINSQKEYLNNREKLIDYQNEKNKIQKKARDNNITLKD